MTRTSGQLLRQCQPFVLLIRPVDDVAVHVGLTTNPACRKWSSNARASLAPYSLMASNEMQSVSPQSLSWSCPASVDG